MKVKRPLVSGGEGVIPVLAWFPQVVVFPGGQVFQCAERGGGMRMRCAQALVDMFALARVPHLIAVPLTVLSVQDPLHSRPFFLVNDNSHSYTHSILALCIVREPTV